ncbi:efflux RND transporter periplasmic adaptor subunit [Bordetella holmesii]|uniref:Biotin-lipoyl-like domain protein n=2 Tax=Bordetella holmesii TaxID=35814 RepID=A0A158M301_9BORD|nr:efflux RND transporter periplasmic adaptor subunit [Bordetella holmesii]AHV91361.1 efflux transporter, RND family, MFP subunit [Bordetella holmesii ATCC 51541]AIT25775.1 efflux transporter, RND family, MFP subunit [Bordetella holmesii 44057]EWM43510.1 efflux transporter, RND family, MFP subunit [Bordetella holmesii 41130]EWM46342.1 efflux transporter, RND family, MFP subunit [Bordetella holmesii 35009]EWM50504.1 efflux transporter, RND family, MFP subunit [Bordetella holmesii 70147]
MDFSLKAGSWRWLAALLIVAVAAAWVWRDDSPSGATGSPQQAVPVEVVLARAAPLRLQLHAIGTVTPLAHVVLRPQVSGQLLRVHYHEGQSVQAGQLLAEVDPRPYEHALQAAQGKLDQTRARLDNARADLIRYAALGRQRAVAHSVLDAARSNVEQAQGQLAAEQAGVDETRRQLALTRITAPITGRVGLRHIDAGNHVRANDATGLTTLVQTGATSVLFTLSEARLPAVREALARSPALDVEA